MRFPYKKQSVPQCWCSSGIVNISCPWLGVEYVNPYEYGDNELEINYDVLL